MAGKHRKGRQSVAKFTALSAATATATALTIGIPAEPNRELDAELTHRVMKADVDLTAAINDWPDPEQIPDLTGGLGRAAYDFGQLAGDFLLRAIVENFNLAALAQAAGADPQTVLDTLLGGVLGQLPASLLDDIIGNIPIDANGLLTGILSGLPIAGDQIAGLVAAILGVLGPVTDLPDTLGELLGVVGIDLSDVLNLSDLNVPGLNIITAGPPFTLLKLLGVDLGWVPGFENSVANEVINSDYLPVEVSINDLLEGLLPGPALALITAITGPLPDLNVVNVRVATVVGFGIGAFAAGMAYDQIVNNLTEQPGGGGPTAVDSVLGSITVLPMILLRNPGRANGGLFARFYPLARLLGIDTVTPETEVTSRGGIPLLETGLSLGGANLIPVKVDGTVQYDPLSDFAAWPNPFSLLNNLAAGILPTYILRGLTLDTIPDQLAAQLAELIPDDYDGDFALRLNLYLTLKSATLPLLEPLYLASDVLNAVTFGAFPINPFNMIANALSPALTSLVNLGYTDVFFNPETGAYERTLEEAGDPTPFLSFPNVNWSQVPGVVFNQLVQGIQKEFFSGNPTPGTPNVLTNLFDFLNGGLLGGGLPLGDLSGLINNLLGNLLGNLGFPQSAVAAQQPNALMAANSVPDPNARSFTLSTSDELDGESVDNTGDSGQLQDGLNQDEQSLGEEPGDEQLGDEEEIVDDELSDEEEIVDDELGDEEEVVDEEQGDEEGVDDEDADDDQEDDLDAGDKQGEDDEPTGPKHAKPDNGESVAPSLNAPRHAKPDSPSDDGANDNDGADSDSGDSGSGDKAA